MLNSEQQSSRLIQLSLLLPFRKILGPMLLTQALDPHEIEMPSPEELKGMIIIKAKKLAEGSPEEQAAAVPVDEGARDMMLLGGTLTDSR